MVTTYVPALAAVTPVKVSAAVVAPEIPAPLTTATPSLVQEYVKPAVALPGVV